MALVPVGRERKKSDQEGCEVVLEELRNGNQWKSSTCSFLVPEHAEKSITVTTV